MRTLDALYQRSWRRAGTVNVLLASACEVVLLVCFIVSLSKRETSNIGSTRIFEGSCGRASTLNTIIHLVLNIISTGVLASSNFFMQIVTSPSRNEIKHCHSYLRSLKIGLQSPTNIPFLSRMKQSCWLILLLSSIPIHLFFNSAVYNTTYQSDEWNVTIATSRFVEDGIENQTYWLPGASLAISGTSSPAQEYDRGAKYAVLPNSGQYVLGFGSPVASGYWSGGNDKVRQKIAATAEHCASWTKLSPQACMDEFRPYKFHTTFKDLVIVVHTKEPEVRGWKRDQVFDFDAGGDLSSIWDTRIPPSEVNSLWFFTRCLIQDWPQVLQHTADFVKGSGLIDTNEEIRAFDHSCGRLFGLNTSQPRYKAANIPDVVSLSFTNDGQGDNTTREEVEKGYNSHPGARDLQIDHCLAEPTTCQVRVSNILILIVMVCVLVKICTCILLLGVLSDMSLVTPGDAIQSFISEPDPITKGISTLGLSEAQDLEFQRREIYPTLSDPNLTFRTQPRRWDGAVRRLYTSVSRGIWVQAYYPIFLALVVVIVGLVFSSNDNFQSFGESANHNVFKLDSLANRHLSLGYLGTLIFINTPQVILSILYLTVNTLHTQLQVEQEWNFHSRRFRPLRVSYPTGKQISTYRLQLPYKYSIPLIAVSILLHWLLANALFLLVVEGGAVSRYVSARPDLAESMGVSPGAAIAIGYSGLSLLIFFCLCLVVVMSPFFFRYRKLKGNMVVGGTNSLVLSAACHVPQVSSAAALRNKNNGTAEILAHLDLGSSDGDDCNHDDYKEYLAEVARSNLRWGAMALPADLAEKMEVDNDEPVMHLGFGTEDHDIQAPQTGVLYA